MQQQDRVVLITGATGGLGKAVATAFLREGAYVVVVYHGEASWRELLKAAGDLKHRLVGEPADVTNAEDVQRVVTKTVDQFGRIDALVNLVGGYAGGKRVFETDEQEWDRMIDLNLKSVFLTCRAVLPHMIREEQGRIVNVSSRAAVKIVGNQAGYTVAKAGVITLSQAIAEEVKAHNITVNAILPSTIDTPANRAAMPKANFANWVQPEEIAAVILMLTSPAAGVVSGGAIPVYGKA